MIILEIQGWIMLSIEIVYQSKDESKSESN